MDGSIRRRVPWFPLREMQMSPGHLKARFNAFSASRNRALEIGIFSLDRSLCGPEIALWKCFGGRLAVTPGKETLPS